MAIVMLEMLDCFFFGMSPVVPAFKVTVFTVILNFELEYRSEPSIVALIYELEKNGNYEVGL